MVVSKARPLTMKTKTSKHTEHKFVRYYFDSPTYGHRLRPRLFQWVTMHSQTRSRTLSTVSSTGFHPLPYPRLWDFRLRRLREDATVPWERSWHQWCFVCDRLTQPGESLWTQKNQRLTISITKLYSSIRKDISPINFKSNCTTCMQVYAIACVDVYYHAACMYFADFLIGKTDNHVGSSIWNHPNRSYAGIEPESLSLPLHLSQKRLKTII